MSDSVCFRVAVYLGNSVLLLASLLEPWLQFTNELDVLLGGYGVWWSSSSYYFVERASSTRRRTAVKVDADCANALCVPNFPVSCVQCCVL